MASLRPTVIAAFAMLLLAACSVDRSGLGSTDVDAFVPPVDGGPRLDMFVMPPSDMFVMPPMDFGPTCVPHCETSVAVTCPAGVEARVDCAPMPAICDATGGPHCVPLACFPSTSSCSMDGTSALACNPAGTMSTPVACARGCDPATSACRPAVDCASFGTAGMIDAGTMRFDLCGAGDDHDHLSSASCTVSADGEDLVVRLEVDRMAHYVINLSDVGGGYMVDSVVYVRTACDDPGTELGCDDDSGSGVDSRLGVDLGPGEYFIVVDSIDTQTGGGTGCGMVDLMVSHS